MGPQELQGINNGSWKLRPPSLSLTFCASASRSQSMSRARGPIAKGSSAGDGSSETPSIFIVVCYSAPSQERKKYKWLLSLSIFLSLSLFLPRPSSASLASSRHTSPSSEVGLCDVWRTAQNGLDTIHISNSKYLLRRRRLVDWGEEQDLRPPAALKTEDVKKQQVTLVLIGQFRVLFIGLIVLPLLIVHYNCLLYYWLRPIPGTPVVSNWHTVQLYRIENWSLKIEQINSTFYCSVRLSFFFFFFPFRKGLNETRGGENCTSIIFLL